MNAPDAALPAPGSRRRPPADGSRHAPASSVRRGLLTILAAGGLTGLYLVYAATVTPLLDSAADAADRVIDGRPTRIAPPPSNRELAERFLPHAPFAAEARYQIGSGRSMMFWNEWEIVEPAGGRSALLVTPFAAVIVDDAGTDPETGGRPPTTLMADTALLRFEKPISEEMVTAPGRVVAGRFNGNVRVDGDDGLRVVGSDFRYLEGDPVGKISTLYSDNPVEFRHGGARENWDDEPAGGHEGTGAGVEIKLFRTRSPGSYDNVAADGLAEVAVRGPVALTLRGGRLPGLDAAGGPLAESAGAEAEAATLNEPDAAPREPVEITATRQLVFDPIANTALFTAVEPGGVRAWRPQPADATPATPEQAGPDELICEEMLVTFAPATPEARAEAAAMRAARAERAWGERPFFAADDDLAAVAVIATGAPVRVNSPARQLKTTSARLEHDVPADVLTLLGRNDPEQAGRVGDGPEWVHVTLPNAVIRCPRLVVTPPDSPPGVDPATVDSPRRLRAEGPGTLLRTNPETGELAARVTWPGTLVTSRDLSLGRDVVTLTGPENPKRDAAGHTELSDQVLVQTFENGSDLAADTVVLELEPNPEADARPADGDGALAGADPLGGSVRPAKAIATGSVRMKGPELLAGAKRVEVDFVDPPPLPPPPPGGAVAGAAAPPAEPAPVEEEEEVADGPPGPTKKFYADAVVATLVRARTANGVEVEAGYLSEAVATGGVGLFQDATPPAEPGGAPGEARFARAARAVMTGNGPDEHYLTLFGAPGTATEPPVPAELNGSGADLTGPEIQFDPQANTAVVVGAGSLDLPVRGGGMPGLVGDSPPAEPSVKDPEAPARKSVRVDWGEKMTFDGTIATFYGGARTLFHGTEGERGTPQFTEDTVRLYCNLMTVTLTEKVTFGTSLPGSGAGPSEEDSGEAEIKLITCHGRVNLRGRQDAPDPRAADPQARTEPREAQRVEANFAQLEVLWKTGDFTAQGRGEMKVWRRDDKAAPPPPSTGTVRPNARSRRIVALPCELIHVDFRREVRGNLNGPDAIFHPDADGRVEVVHGPVRDFGVELLPAPDTPLPAGASRMMSDRLDLRHVPAADAAPGEKRQTRELFARGNVEIDGHGESSAGRPGAWYSANSARATYNEAKGRLELAGDANNLVQLYRSNTQNGPKDLFTGRTVVYFPATNTVDAKGIQGADALP